MKQVFLFSFQLVLSWIRLPSKSTLGGWLVGQRVVEPTCQSPKVKSHVKLFHALNFFHGWGTKDQHSPGVIHDKMFLFAGCLFACSTGWTNELLSLINHNQSSMTDDITELSQVKSKQTNKQTPIVPVLVRKWSLVGSIHKNLEVIRKRFEWNFYSFWWSELSSRPKTAGGPDQAWLITYISAWIDWSQAVCLLDLVDEWTISRQPSSVFHDRWHYWRFPGKKKLKYTSSWNQQKWAL